MTPFALSSLTAAIAAVGFAFAAADNSAPEAYQDGPLTRLSQVEAADHAGRVFDRADRDGDAALNVDEFAALAVVTAELAHLNGFVAVEVEDEVKTIALPASQPSALPASQPSALARSEHARIDAVARHAFYGFAGADGFLDRDEYIRMQSAVFEASDLNANGRLNKRELTVYARRQAYVPTGA